VGFESTAGTPDTSGRKLSQKAAPNKNRAEQRRLFKIIITKATWQNGEFQATSNHHSRNYESRTTPQQQNKGKTGTNMRI